MRVNKEDKTKLCLYISNVLNDRLDSDSIRYGITKTALITSMVVEYYRRTDSCAVDKTV